MGNIQHRDIKSTCMNSCLDAQQYQNIVLTDPVVCFAACSLWQGQCENIRSKDNLFARMSYHHFPGSLLCFRKFWRSQRKDEVNYFPWLKNLIFSSLVVEIRVVNFLFSFRDFAKSINRPFSVYFNPYTQSIEILKDTRSIENVVQDLRSDLNTVCDALSKMNRYLGIWYV